MCCPKLIGGMGFEPFWSKIGYRFEPFWSETLKWVMDFTDYHLKASKDFRGQFSSQLESGFGKPVAHKNPEKFPPSPGPFSWRCECHSGTKRLNLKRERPYFVYVWKPARARLDLIQLLGQTGANYHRYDLYR